ncbi:hypothetical protein IECKMCGE_06980 [Robbsia andropogonis]|nr:hypothetical protein [Robbsia andropogonis]
MGEQHGNRPANRMTNYIDGFACKVGGGREHHSLVSSISKQCGIYLFAATYDGGTMIDP